MFAFVPEMPGRARCTRQVARGSERSRQQVSGVLPPDGDRTATGRRLQIP
ncbi:hypothetical protein [Streptomyces sp. NPDC094437]